jgi:hypothetical protein
MVFAKSPENGRSVVVVVRDGIALQNEVLQLRADEQKADGPVVHKLVAESKNMVGELFILQGSRQSQGI